MEGHPRVFSAEPWVSDPVVRLWTVFLTYVRPGGYVLGREGRQKEKQRRPCPPGTSDFAGDTETKVSPKWGNIWWNRIRDIKLESLTWECSYLYGAGG